VTLEQFALELVAARSISGSEGEVAALVGAEMRRLGYEVERDELGNVVGTIELGPGAVLLLDSHMDTVGVTDQSAWSRDPAGELADGRLYGRGAMDMKGPLAAAIHGVASLRGGSAGTVVVSATVGEELVEGPALQRVAEGRKPDLVLICEATSLRVAHGQRGRAEILLEAFGQPTHSSRPELGVNAIEAMIEILRELRQLDLARHESLGPAILAPTDVISRPYPALSVVPDYCVATLDRRTLPGETEADVLGSISDAIERALRGSRAAGRATIAMDDFSTYTGAHVAAPNFAPAWYYPPDSPMIESALSSLQVEGIPSGLATYAFCTNGSVTAGRMGIATLGFGPGEEELAHRVDEYIDLDQLAAGARGYAAICRGLIEAGPPWV
jgi:putative selenium metabolism hydrolase